MPQNSASHSLGLQGPQQTPAWWNYLKELVQYELAAFKFETKFSLIFVTSNSGKNDTINYKCILLRKKDINHACTYVFKMLLINYVSVLTKICKFQHYYKLFPKIR